MTLRILPEDRLTAVERRLTALERRVDGLATREQVERVSDDVAELKGMVQRLLDSGRL